MHGCRARTDHGSPAARPGAGGGANNPGLPLTPPHPWKVAYDFEARLGTDEGWAKLNRHYWERDWAGFSQFFFDQLFPEPHSTKQREDGVEWASGTTVAAMLCENDAPSDPAADHREVCRRVRCPVLVITGSEDRCQVPDRGQIVAELTGGDLVRSCSDVRGRTRSAVRPRFGPRNTAERDLGASTADLIIRAPF